MMMETDNAMNSVPLCQNPDRYFAESMIPHHQVCIAFGITTFFVHACQVFWYLTLLCSLRSPLLIWPDSTTLPHHAGCNPYGAVGAQVRVKC